MQDFENEIDLEDEEESGSTNEELERLFNVFKEICEYDDVLDILAYVIEPGEVADILEAAINSRNVDLDEIEEEVEDMEDDENREEEDE